jgi:hypothetical protein
MKNEIMVLQSKSWLTTEGNIITSPFPPEKSLTLGKNVEATAYLAVQSKKTDNNIITLQEFNSVIRSQNYTNSFLNCLGNQLTSIEQELINLKNLFEKQIRKDYEVKIESIDDTPIIQPPIHIEGFKIQKDSDEFANILDEKLKQLRLSVINDMEDLSEYDKTEIDQLATMFASQDINDKPSINPIYAPRALDKHYYKRPSPHDLLFEETENFQTSYSGKSIYEWNIDGLNDKQIIDMIHRMIMYSTVCKQQQNSDSSIASYITTGFVGQLRGWWDHYLSDTQKKEILSHKKVIKVEESSSSIVTTAMTGEEDAVYTLCLSILQHFVGMLWLIKYHN